MLIITADVKQSSCLNPASSVSTKEVLRIVSFILSRVDVRINQIVTLIVVDITQPLCSLTHFHAAGRTQLVLYHVCRVLTLCLHLLQGPTGPLGNPGQAGPPGPKVSDHLIEPDRVP